MKKYLCFFFLCLNLGGLNAQSSVKTIRGRLVEQTNATPKGIPYVNIGFPAYSIGTSSNELGDFLIKIPQERWADTLTFSSIGYATLRIAVRELLSKENTVITLKSNEVNLNEFIVKALDANKILRSFFKNVSKNYNTEPALMQVFCRETMKKTDENRYFTQSEGVVEMYKSSVKKEDDHVRLLKGRKKNVSDIYVDSDSNAYKIPEIVNGPTTAVILDIVKNSTFFIENNKQFTFTHNGYELINDRLAYILDFSPKDSSVRELGFGDHDFYTGKIFIDTANFALVRTEFQLSSRGLRVIDLQMRRSNTPMKINKRHIIVNYAEYNNKWYFKSAYVENDYTHLGAGIKLKNKLEALVTAVKTEAVKKFPSSLDIRENESLVNKITDFDESFWEDYNIIKSVQTDSDTPTSIANTPEGNTPTPTIAQAKDVSKKQMSNALAFDSQSNKQVDFLKISLAEAKKLATAQKKYIFIDVYTTWCGPCKKMAAEAFTDVEVSELMNTFFINLKADAEADGRSIAAKYNVRSYPTTLIIDSTGAVIADNKGYMNVSIFLNQIEDAVSKSAKGQVFLALQTAHLKRKKDFDIRVAFANFRKQLGMSNESVTDDLVKIMPLDSFQLIHYQQFINTFSSDIDSKTFDFILNHRNLLLFENKLKLLIQKSFNLAVNRKDKNLLKKVLKANAKILNDPSVSDEKNAQLTLKFNEETHNLKGYHESAVDLLTTHYLPKLTTNSDSLTQAYKLKVAQIGQYYSDNIKEKKQMQVLVELLNKACDKHECSELVRVYSQILYRLNDVEKAKQWMQKALTLSGNSVEIAAILAKMEKGIF